MIFERASKSKERVFVMWGGYLPSEVRPHPLTRASLPTKFWFFSDRGGKAIDLMYSEKQFFFHDL